MERRPTGKFAEMQAFVIEHKRFAKWLRPPQQDLVRRITEGKLEETMLKTGEKKVSVYARLSSVVKTIERMKAHKKGEKTRVPKDFDLDVKINAFTQAGIEPEELGPDYGKMLKLPLSEFIKKLEELKAVKLRAQGVRRGTVLS